MRCNKGDSDCRQHRRPGPCRQDLKETEIAFIHSKGGRKRLIRALDAFPPFRGGSAPAERCDLVYSHAAQHCRWLQEHGVKKAVYLPVLVPDNARRLIDKPKESNDPLRIIMVGNVAMTATRLGLRFLTEDILPHLDALWQKTRGFELQIFGGGKLDERTSRKIDFKWIRVMGYAEDIGKEFYNSDVLLVPTPDNVGFRTRISEGFSYGCCVVTHIANTLGMPELKDGENSLICTMRFFTAISHCLESKAAIRIYLCLWCR